MEKRTGFNLLYLPSGGFSMPSYSEHAAHVRLTRMFALCVRAWCFRPSRLRVLPLGIAAEQSVHYSM